jgi:hypothetical protein
LIVGVGVVFGVVSMASCSQRVALPMAGASSGVVVVAAAGDDAG